MDNYLLGIETVLIGLSVFLLIKRLREIEERLRYLETRQDGHDVTHHARESVSRETKQDA